MKNNKINLREILDSVETLIMTGDDFEYIFKDESIGDEFIHIYNMYASGDFKYEVIESFLLANEEYINKENLILILARNIQIQINTINEMEENLKLVGTIDNKDAKEKAITDDAIKRRKAILEKSIKLISSKWKGLNTIFTFYKYDEKNRQYIVDVADSREIIDRKNINANKNKKRFNEINATFVEEGKDEENIGIQYLLQILNLNDFKQAFINESFYTNIIRVAYNRKIADVKGISSKEAQIFSQNDKEECSNLITEMRFDNYAPYMEKILEELIKYVDFDKLLLITAYRLETGLEQIASEKKTEGYKAIVEAIAENIEDKEKIVTYIIECENKDKQIVEVEKELSYKKLEKFLGRFANDQYISQSTAKGYREEVDNKEKNFYDLPNEYIDIIFSTREIEERISLSEENFMFAIEKFNWDNMKIIENLNEYGIPSIEFISRLVALNKINSTDVCNLYFEGVLNLEDLNKMAAVLDLSDIINSNILNEQYKKTIQSNSTEENTKTYKKYLNLYKSMYVDGKDEEEKEALSEEIIELIMENNTNDNKKLYLAALENYFENGIITLNSVIHWGEMLLDLNEEQIVMIFYKDGLINVKDVQNLIVNKELDFEFFSRLVLNGQINKEEIIKIAFEGLISEQDITKLYKKGILSDKIIKQLEQKNIISSKRAKKILDKVSEKELQEAEWILGEDFEKVSSKNGISSNIYYGEGNEGYKQTFKFIIHPNEREKLFELMGAYKKTKNINVNESNPFYNYDFYLIPDEEDGIKGKNSIVIAERIYEDKNTQDRFAVDNATYFFYYKDIPQVIRGAYRNKGKALEEMESQKIIKHRVNHFILDEQRNGHWALGVLFKAALMMSEDDEIFSKEKAEQKTEALRVLFEKYSDDELKEIFKQQERIDNTDECLYEILECLGNEEHNSDNDDKDDKYTEDIIL